jgi:hypothetical protein
LIHGASSHAALHQQKVPEYPALFPQQNISGSVILERRSLTRVETASPGFLYAGIFEELVSFFPVLFFSAIIDDILIY